MPNQAADSDVQLPRQPFINVGYILQTRCVQSAAYYAARRGHLIHGLSGRLEGRETSQGHVVLEGEHDVYPGHTNRPFAPDVRL